jgi:hypothetical protein
VRASSRLGRLYPGLSGRERARLIVQAMREERQPASELFAGIAADQEEMFGELLGLARAANTGLAWLAFSYQQEVQELETRLAWFTTLRVWATDSWEALLELAVAPELVTASEYERRQAEAAADWWSVHEAAEHLAVWDEANDELEDEEWAAAVAAKASEVRALAGDGQVVSRGQGKRTRVQAGSLLARVRLPVPVAPTYGVGTLVVRDADEPAVARAAARHAALREVLQRAPLSLRFCPEPGLHPSTRSLRNRRWRRLRS